MHLLIYCCMSLHIKTAFQYLESHIRSTQALRSFSVSPFKQFNRLSDWKRLYLDGVNTAMTPARYATNPLSNLTLKLTLKYTHSMVLPWT